MGEAPAADQNRCSTRPGASSPGIDPGIASSRADATTARARARASAQQLEADERAVRRMPRVEIEKLVLTPATFEAGLVLPDVRYFAQPEISLANALYAG